MKVARLSCDSCATVARQSRAIFSKDRNSRISRINVHSMRPQRESCVFIVNFCREIVANYSRTSLQLSHSNEIGALLTDSIPSNIHVEILTCSHLWRDFVVVFIFVLEFNTCMHNFGRGQTTYLSQTYPFPHDPSITLCSTLATLVGKSTVQEVCNAYLLTFIVVFLFIDSLGTPHNIQNNNNTPHIVHSNKTYV